ncbi:MAG: S8 family serine peptidase [Acidimicrobiia bacterium]|nr:S8 family serine peptidase [Acidimicrobiia bacterium]
MSQKPHTVGVNWIRPVVALMAVFALMAALVATKPAASDHASASPVAELSLSMVELLSQSDMSDPVMLAELGDDVLRSGFDGSDGSGVDVALIDSGVSPVDGLNGDNVLYGPDLSMEAASPEVAFLDTYGHGTHMAGIIVGERDAAPGIAPGARLVSVKVAGSDGATSIAQVVAGIDWVVDHHDTDGLNIRVLNLSLGQAGVTSHIGDPLSAAVERAWDAGIVVVVAAGNRGETQAHLDSPAIDPYVLAVGASDSSTGQSIPWQPVPDWSALGDGRRNPDLVAPGRSIASYRVPGSTVDQLVPTARYGADLFLGSGTSQAAAVVSGLAARAIGEYPGLDADDLKATLERGARSLNTAGPIKSGDGRVRRDWPRFDSPTQDFTRAAGAGTGIVTPAGATWSGGGWSGATWSGATWSGATWSGGTWSGATWSGATWSGATWSGATWSGATWSGATWSGATWSGATWSGATWSGTGWTGSGTLITDIGSVGTLDSSALVSGTSGSLESNPTETVLSPDKVMDAAVYVTE